MSLQTEVQQAPSKKTVGKDARGKQAGGRRTLTVYIGNMPYNTTEREIRKIFRPYAPIHAIIIITDKSGKSRGFGFIVLEEQKAELAINDLDHKIFGGRSLRICEATGVVSRRRERCVSQRGDV